ncbi:hypothetical protein FOA52_013719 [Chlamydomonas sp. UWO 241]|nr:hypothetical protein FOA52_013719 [Chlamydomonas sp. UWO 241]
MSIEEVATNVAINVSALLFLGFFLRRDLQARDKQMARLVREEQLGRLGLQLASGKRLPMGALRGSKRVVIAAGTRAQVRDALAAAEPYREELIVRGVFVVPVTIYEGDDTSVELPPLTPEDLRWRASPVRMEEWQEWFGSQLQLATKASSEKGLFVGLRLDGRVRTSGQGMPPWTRFLAELAPMTGDDKWAGFFDGFDGRVGSMD